MLLIKATINTIAKLTVKEQKIYLQLNQIGIPTRFDLAKIHEGKLYVWHTASDDRVCKECEVLNDSEYERIDDIPDDPHLNCRCFIEEIELEQAQSVPLTRTI